MTLTQIRSFLAVVRCGSFRRAARELGVSQAGLTTSLRALETSLSGTLLARSSNGVALTPFGKRILVRAEIISREMENAVRDAEDFRGVGTGTLNVGFGPTPTAVLLHLVAPDFHAKFPAVKLSVTSGFYEELRPALLRGEIEMALTAAPARAPSPDLATRTLFKSELVVIARKDHPLRMCRRLKDLADCEWVLMGPSGGPGGTTGRFHQEQGLPAPRVAATCETPTQMAALLRSTDWLAIFPIAMVQHGLLGMNVAPIALEEQLPVFENCIFYRKDIELSPSARAFMAMCESAGRILACSRLG